MSLIGGVREQFQLRQGNHDMSRTTGHSMRDRTIELNDGKEALSNCYNCGRAVYGTADAKAGGHVFCSRKCREEWERCQARRRAAKEAAKRRAEEAKRIRKDNVRIDSENARRREKQAELNHQAEVREKRYRSWAWAAGIPLVLWAIFKWL